jgi:hypothetical protein
MCVRASYTSVYLGRHQKYVCTWPVCILGDSVYMAEAVYVRAFVREVGHVCVYECVPASVRSCVRLCPLVWTYP